jgi:SAM-dependent methyltransferase
VDADPPVAGFRPVAPDESVRANRAWWDAEADDYLAEHGAELAAGLVWGPEGLDEASAGLLGDVTGRDVLEVGAGAAQCARWVARRGGRVVACDLSAQMLRHARRDHAGAADLGATPDGAATRGAVLVQCDARALPFAAGSFDVAFSAYGAVPFVADPRRVFAEVARVLRPGGRWVFSVTHPIRWVFPDDPGPAGLTVGFSYFDRTPYVEADAGRIRYAEHHRTLGDRVRDLVATGFVLDDVVEPEWPADLGRAWGGWSPQRGRLIPGTAIFVTHLGPPTPP